MPKLQDLELQIKQTGSTSTAGLKNLSAALENLAGASSKASQASQALKQMGAAVKSLGDTQTARSSSGAIKQAISDVGKNADVSAEKLERMRAALATIKTGATSASDGLKHMQQILTETTPGQVAAAYERLVAALQSGSSEKISAALKEYGDVLSHLPPKEDEATNGAHRLRNALASAGNAVSTAFKGAIGSITGFAKHLASGVWDRFKSKITGLAGSVGNLVSSFKRIAMYRLLRTAIKAITQGFSEGIKHVYEWARAVDNGFKQSMDSLATSAHYLKDSLGAMASPLLDMLAPAIDALVDKFVGLLNIVNQFFATLSGSTTWRKAVKTQTTWTTGLEDATGAAKEATEAQKKLNKAVQDFDELHIITTSETKGRQPSGSGKDKEDYSLHFEEVPVADWIQEIKDAIERGEWYEAGSLLAEKLNSIIEDWDAEGWGRSLGQKVQNGIEFYLGFMKTMDWENLGWKVADFLNGMIDEIDPKDLGEAIVQKFNAAIGFLNGFTKNFDWSAAGEWLADVIVGAFTGINWESAGELLKNLAGGILDMLEAGIKKLWDSKEEILNAIGDFFSGLGWDGLKNVVKLTLIVAGMKALWAAVFGNAGLIASVKNSIGGMLGAATPSGGFLITCAIGLVWASMEIAENIKKYGVETGITKSLGIAEPITLALGLEVEYTGKPFTEVIGKGGFGIADKITTSLGIEVDWSSTEEIGKKLLGLIEGIGDAAINAGKFISDAFKGIGDVFKAAAEGGEKVLKFLDPIVGFVDKGIIIDFILNDEDFKAKVQWAEDRLKKFMKALGMDPDAVDETTSSGTSMSTWGQQPFSTPGAQSGGNENDPKYLSISEAQEGLDRLNRAMTTLTGKEWNLKLVDENDQLATSTSKAKTLVGTSGLGGIKSSYKTTLTMTGLADGSTQSKTLVGSSGLGGLKNKYSSEVNVAHVKDGADYSATLKSNLTGINGKTYTPKVTLSGYTGKSGVKSELDTLLSTLKNLSKNTYTAKVAVKGTGLSVASGSGKAEALEISLKADGGYVNSGDLFIANEQGPELIGTINGKTAVGSGREITGIADAVYNTGEAEANLLREQNRLLRQLLAKNNTVTLAPNAAAGRWVAQAQSAYAKATG